VAGRKLKGFSGGMKRRVGIAQALLNDPRLLIVDEPTAGLDPEERIRFRNILAALAGDRTVILSTHIVEDVAQTCRNLAVLAGGRVLFAGTAAGLVDAARGQVWTIEANAPITMPGATVVSTLHLGNTMQYRVVGDLNDTDRATPAVPSLEDGYVALMQRRRATAVNSVTIPSVNEMIR
jgi:ABC-2 type transport system ATP-binding protein